MTNKLPAPIIVVGAGLAGLLAARTVQDAGREVIVLERSEQVGGRMATRQIDLGEGKAATFDHGAQYFTVREERFQAWVDRWQAAGVVEQWSTGFATPDASAYRDGHARYRGTVSMAAIPRHLARGLDVRLQSAVVALEYGERWQVTTAAGERLAASALLLTPPVPQALALLVQGELSLPAAVEEALARIDYDPCFAVLALLAGPSAIPDPGGLWPGGQAISWMADNRQKGISSLPAVTIHGSAQFSRAHFDEEPDEVARLLLAEAAPWLGSAVVAYQVKRWRYSIPVHMYHRHCLPVTAPGRLVFAGDAFAGPRVEGAALSGLAAADFLLKQ